MTHFKESNVSLLKKNSYYSHAVIFLEIFNDRRQVFKTLVSVLYALAMINVECFRWLCLSTQSCSKDCAGPHDDTSPGGRASGHVLRGKAQTEHSTQC
jgi:hypothetical protein